MSVLGLLVKSDLGGLVLKTIARRLVGIFTTAEVSAALGRLCQAGSIVCGARKKWRATAEAARPYAWFAR